MSTHSVVILEEYIKLFHMLIEVNPHDYYESIKSNITSHVFKINLKLIIINLDSCI